MKNIARNLPSFNPTEKGRKTEYMRTGRRYKEDKGLSRENDRMIGKGNKKGGQWVKKKN